jgi:hypothetical protein
MQGSRWTNYIGASNIAKLHCIFAENEEGEKSVKTR